MGDLQTEEILIDQFGKLIADSIIIQHTTEQDW